MTYLELFASRMNYFSGIQKPFEEAKYIVLGVPFDSTSSYRNGSRFGPDAKGWHLLNIETYSFRSGVELKI